ncbi:hypothetical protein V6N13_007759 [Hibiscus sabdariffa]
MLSVPTQPSQGDFEIRNREEDEQVFGVDEQITKNSSLLAQENSLCDTEITLPSDIDDAQQNEKEQCEVVTPRSDEQVFGAGEISAKQQIVCHEDSVPAVKRMESILGENLTLDCHEIKVDAINQKCNAKTIEQQIDAMKREILRLKTKDLMKNLDQDEDDYASTTKRFFGFNRWLFKATMHKKLCQEIIPSSDTEKPKAKVTKAEPTSPMPAGLVADTPPESEEEGIQRCARAVAAPDASTATTSELENCQGSSL